MTWHCRDWKYGDFYKICIKSIKSLPFAVLECLQMLGSRVTSECVRSCRGTIHLWVISTDLSRQCWFISFMRETTNASIVLQFPAAIRSNRELSCAVHPPAPLLSQIKHRSGKKHRFIGLMLENYSSLFVLWQLQEPQQQSPSLLHEDKQSTVLIKPQFARNLSQKRCQIKRAVIICELPFCPRRAKRAGKALDATRATEQRDRRAQVCLSPAQDGAGAPSSSHGPQGTSGRNSHGKASPKLPCPSSKGVQLQPAARRAQSNRNCPKVLLVFTEIHQKCRQCEWPTHSELPVENLISFLSFLQELFSEQYFINLIRRKRILLSRKLVYILWWFCCKQVLELGSN